MLEDKVHKIKRQFGIIGQAKALDWAIATALQVAPTSINVLITGQSGTGKESFSKIIHHYSAHKHGRCIAINCGAIPEGTIDSELFGHEKGAFTGASDARKGYFEEANGGTIFLDEIGEMPMSTQSRLLRVLEYGEFMKVGSSKVQKTQVRVVAATHVDLLDAVRRNKFREDLYYRLSAVPIYVPSLQERGEDVVLLAQKFALDFADQYAAEPIALDTTAQKVLMQYSFPGNIRQLKNLIDQISLLEEKRAITAEILSKYLPQKHLPAVWGTESSPNTATPPQDVSALLMQTRQELEELRAITLHIIDHLGLIDSNAADASQLLAEKMPKAIAAWSHPGSSAAGAAQTAPSSVTSQPRHTHGA